MARFVAVCPALPPDLGAIKRNLLLFEKLLVVSLKEQRLAFRHMPDLVPEFDYLVEQELVREAPGPLQWRREWNERGTPRQILEFFDYLQQRRIPAAWQERHVPGAEQTSAAFDWVRTEVVARVSAIALRADLATDAVVLPSTLESFGTPLFDSSILPSDVRWRFPEVWQLLQGTGKDQVAEVTLTHFPVPDEKTPWEDLLSFRKDPDSLNKFMRLKVWLNALAKEELSPAEVHDRLEWGMAEYRSHLDLHHIKHKQGVLRVLLSSSAALTEALVRLRFRKALDVFFQASERKLALLEAEASAPGRELAYIVKVRTRFATAFGRLLR